MIKGNISCSRQPPKPDHFSKQSINMVANNWASLNFHRLIWRFRLPLPNLFRILSGFRSKTRDSTIRCNMTRPRIKCGGTKRYETRCVALGRAFQQIWNRIVCYHLVIVLLLLCYCTAIVLLLLPPKTMSLVQFSPVNWLACLSFKLIEILGAIFTELRCRALSVAYTKLN